MPVALITGAAQGLGHATALRLASDGFTVAVNDLADDGFLLWPNGPAVLLLRRISPIRGWPAMVRAVAGPAGNGGGPGGQRRGDGDEPVVVVLAGRVVASDRRQPVRALPAHPGRHPRHARPRNGQKRNGRPHQHMSTRHFPSLLHLRNVPHSAFIAVPTGYWGSA